ncbi:MAG TPA: hypothetical protein VM166_05635 [Gemmatimonadaceae bacterium]|nr:hypothetical protein [Gemmatimonadaceae bacterium]
MSRILRSIRPLAVVAGLVVFGGCQVTTDAAVPVRASITVGYGQSQPAGTVFPIPLGIIVVDQYDYGAPNVQVTWKITSGGGSLSAATTTTSDAGVTSNVYTAGQTAGTVTITADVAGVGQLTFTETVT